MVFNGGSWLQVPLFCQHEMGSENWQSVKAFANLFAPKAKQTRKTNKHAIAMYFVFITVVVLISENRTQLSHMQDGQYCSGRLVLPMKWNKMAKIVCGFWRIVVKLLGHAYINTQHYATNTCVGNYTLQQLTCAWKIHLSKTSSKFKFLNYTV